MEVQPAEHHLSHSPAIPLPVQLRPHGPRTHHPGVAADFFTQQIGRVQVVFKAPGVTLMATALCRRLRAKANVLVTPIVPGSVQVCQMEVELHGGVVQGFGANFGTVLPRAALILPLTQSTRKRHHRHHRRRHASSFVASMAP